MQGVNILNTTEILGNPSWAINLISIGLFIATIGAIFMIISVSAAIESDMSDDIIYGYGYYGGSIYESNGKYYMRYSIGCSCD